jgi:hypothetical protein
MTTSSHAQPHRGHPAHRAAALAWSLLAAWGILTVLNVWQTRSGTAGENQYVAVFMTGYATVGAVTAARRPGNAIGWLLLTIALMLSFQAVGESYVLSRSNPGYLAVAWVCGWTFNVWFILLGVFLPLLFPDGRLLSRRWRPVLWSGVAAVLGTIVATGFRPGELAIFAAIDNPVGAEGLALHVVTAVQWLTVGMVVLLVPASVASLVLRVHRSRGAERQQLKWFLLAGLIMLGGFACASVGALLGARGSLLGDVGFTVFLSTCILGIPAAFAIAMLKHRLYDVDVVINRTLVYGVLTTSLLGTYVGLVLVLRFVLSPITGKNDLAVAGSTLVVAALFRPARTRIQATVDRRFYRRRYDARRTLDEFADQLTHELDLDAVGSHLCSAANRCVEPTHSSLWLRP